MYEPATGFLDDPGRMDPATEKPPPVESEPWWCEPPLKACSAPGGREKALPSWSVTIRIPGRRGAGGGAAFASEAAATN